MKKVILLAVCLFTVSATISAQEAPPKTERTPGSKAGQKMTTEQRVQKNVDEINNVATLNDDQKIKVRELALTKINKTEAIKTKYKDQPENNEVAQKELEVVRKEYHQGLKSILTPEQMEKVQAKNKEMKASKDAKRAEKH